MLLCQDFNEQFEGYTQLISKLKNVQKVALSGFQ